MLLMLHCASNNWLHIAAGAHAAHNLSVVATTSDSATVSWYPAYDNGRNIHYVLWYVFRSVFDSAKEVIFSLCLFVYLLAGLR